MTLSIHPSLKSLIEIKDEAQLEEPECESVLDEEYFDILKKLLRTNEK